jgi:hypothetical protein
MKTLPAILRDAIDLLDNDHERVVIARGEQHEPLDDRSHAFQMRLRRDVDMDLNLSTYRCETRSWLGEQWSSWREQGHRLGGGSFDIDAVLATDWRIVS